MSRGTTDKAHWLDALRRYRKTSGVLCNVGDGDGPGYCCLGVLAAEDEVLKIEDGWRVEFLNFETDDEGDVIGEKWLSPSEADEEYLFHPRLSHEAQSILIRANDCSERFEELVIPLIEQLFNDDLTLKAEHLHTVPENHRLGVFLSSLTEWDRQQFFRSLVERMAGGEGLMTAFAALGGQDADEEEEATDG